MRIILKTLAFFSLTAMIGCSSPLSDTPVSDPGLITPTIILEHYDGDNGVNNKATACLTDKNGAYIELLVGDVQIDDDLMEFSMTCYKRTIDIKPQEEYNVKVTLADSTEYPFSVTTPSNFKKVDYPNKVKKGNSFEVSWKNDNTSETKVNFSALDSTNNWVVIFEEYTDNNSILIDPDNFPKGDIKKGMITLSKTTKGEIPDGFNGGSIVARSVFEKTIKIK